MIDQVFFTLYVDPTGVESTNPADLVAQWDGATMPNDAWFSVVLPQDPRACAAGICRYNLDVTWQGNILANVQNNFKLDVKGQLALLAGSSYGFIGYGPNDPDSIKFPATTFDGTFTFWPFLAAPSPFLDVWTGDFDRADDTDDPNSPAFPPFTYPAVTVAEAASPGAPADDAPVGSPLRISPSIYQEITDIDESWTVTDTNPSGDKEWELFRVVVSPDGSEDVVVPHLDAGLYRWQIKGMDGRNTLFIHPKT